MKPLREVVMPKLLTDERIIDELLDFYADDLKNSLRSSLTGAELAAPSTRQAKAQWLGLALYRPEVGLVWGADLAFSQLDIYLPYLKRTKKRVAIFAKSLKGKSAGSIKANVPSFIPSEEFIPSEAIGAVPSLGALLYVTDKLENFNYIRRNPHCIHAFTGHGESDKHSSSSRLVHVYDHVFAASANSIERFRQAGVEVPAKNFLLVGGSPIEGVIPDEPVSAQHVLYAPTWEGHGADRNYSSASRITDALKTFKKEGGELRFKPHPGMGTKASLMKTVKETILSLINEEKHKKGEDFNWSDVLVADVSGVVSEYLFTKKPIIIPVGPPGDWLRDYILGTSLPQYAYLWPYSELSLREMLLQIQNDPLREARLRRREELYLGADTVDELCALFDNAMNYCLAGHRQHLLRTPQQLLTSRAAERNFKGTPADASLGEVVREIRRGKLVFAA
jgi:hypothetical protein